VDRSFPHRLTAFLAAALLLFSWTGDVLGQHACPHHSAVPGAAAHASGRDHGGGPAGHGAHHAPAAADHDHDSGSLPGGQHDACTCLGACPSAVATALPADSEAGLRVAPDWVRAAPGDDHASVLPRLLPFVLPYGQAPPALG